MNHSLFPWSFAGNGKLGTSSTVLDIVIFPGKPLWKGGPTSSVTTLGSWGEFILTKMGSQI